MKPRGVPRQHRARVARRRGRRSSRRCAAGQLAGAALDVVQPVAGGAAAIRSSASRTSSSRRTSAARRTRRSHRGAAMVADEIERFAAGEPLVQRRQPRRCSRGRASRRAYLLAIDLGTGSCRAVLFDDGRHPGRDRPARVVARRAARRARLAGLRHDGQLGADLRVHPRGARGAAAIAGRRRRGVSARACARAWSCTTRPAARSGPARTSTRAPAPRRPSSSRAARRGASSTEGGDWVSITSPARFLWIRAHEPGRAAADRPRRDAQRLGPLPADRRVRHRSVVRLELGPVRPAARTWSPSACSTWSACRREVVPGVLEPGTVVGPVTAGPPTRPGSRRDARRRGRRRHAARPGRHRVDRPDR